MDGQTEFLPILEDFLSCGGRCPSTFCNFTTSKKQGKGTADLMMPFGDWLIMPLFTIPFNLFMYQWTHRCPLMVDSKMLSYFCVHFLQLYW